MSGNFKIRLLLLVLTIAFACTAITINITVDHAEVLTLDAQKLEKRLHNREIFVKRFLEERGIAGSLADSSSNEEAYARHLVDLSASENIYIQTFKRGVPDFWSSVQVLLNSDSLLREGSTLIHKGNGYYEAIKKSWGDFSVVCFIPVMSEYPYENRYLRNQFSDQLIAPDHLQIASLEDRNVENIRNIDGKYLFSVKLKSNHSDNFYAKLELWMWIGAVLFCLTFITHLCISIAQRGRLWWAIGLMFGALGIFRFLDLKLRFLASRFDLEIFNPEHYSADFFAPSIGDLLINVLAVTWGLTFVHGYRDHLLSRNTVKGKVLSCILFIVAGLIVCASAILVNSAFFGLVTSATVDFDVTNVVNSNWLTWLGLLIYCVCILDLYLLTDSVLAFADKLNLTHRERLSLFAGGLLILVIDQLFFSSISGYFLVFATVLMISGWAYYRYQGRLNPGVVVVCLLLLAVLASLKLSRFHYLKERSARKILAAKLLSSSDTNAVLQFRKIESQILEDRLILDYFTNPLAKRGTLNNRLSKLYMAGYLSRYDFSSYEYDDREQFVKGDKRNALSQFKDLVVSGSVKVSEYFYRVNNTFGYQHYFALLPINDNGDQVGTLVIELRSQDTNQAGAFPELLSDAVEPDRQFQDYSYAYYTDNRLLNQQGNYVYNLTNDQFKVSADKFAYVESKEGDRKYSHLVYQPNERKLIVVSREVNTPINQLASVAFIFLILLFFSVFIYTVDWLWHRFQTYPMTLRSFRWNYLITTNRMLYKTRIQFSMVFAVVVTLLITGLITFYNISRQYREQQNETVQEKIHEVAASFTKQVSEEDLLAVNDQSRIAFNHFADLNGADLNLFNVKGDLLHTTQPKIYENGLIEPKMNALAYLYLNRLQKSEHINEEYIGDLRYLASYVPVRNSRNEPIAYLNLPYFSNQRDYESRIGSFLNALINVYVLVFVAIGFFAVFVANRITSPLTMIQKSLSETKIGRKNEPIPWKRNDEIGNLIKEYNLMIAALEESAQKLARSERETAWREMAKQVAHEIKNPLTPLKLGVQLLDKAWKEKDPKFDAKFEKFSKSFIEQIESLSHIASEFSNFAKMPETTLEGVHLRDLISQSIEVYRQSERTSINFNDQCGRRVFVKADKDQLLRCFNNLIKNAIEARRDGAEIQISILMHCRNKDVVVEISDNGTGIPESLEERIFTPNFTTKSSGTGLGLAFVKQAIENIDGRISFKTRPGEGTTFYVSIPMISVLA